MNDLEPVNGRDIYGPHAMRFSFPARAFFGALAVIGLAGAGFGFAGRLEDSKQARSDKLRGCQSTIAVQYVSAPQAAALKALADYGFEDDKFKDAAAELRPDLYKKLTRLALTDQDAFLRACDRIADSP